VEKAPNIPTTYFPVGDVNRVQKERIVPVNCRWSPVWGSHGATPPRRVCIGVQKRKTEGGKNGGPFAKRSCRGGGCGVSNETNRGSWGRKIKKKPPKRRD